MVAAKDSFPEVQSSPKEKLITDEGLVQVQDVRAYLDDEEMSKSRNSKKRVNTEISVRIISYLLYNFHILFGFFLIFFGYREPIITSTMIFFIFSYDFVLYAMLLFFNYQPKRVLHQFILFFWAIFQTYLLSVVDYFSLGFKNYLISITSALTLLTSYFMLFSQELLSYKNLTLLSFALVLVIANLKLYSSFPKYFMMIQSALIGGLVFPIYLGVVIGNIDSFENRLYSEGSVPIVLWVKVTYGVLCVCAVLFSLGIQMTLVRLLKRSWNEDDDLKAIVD